VNPRKPSTSHPGTGTTTGRKPRADGVQSRQAILHAAAHLATTRGLEGLSIGELAQHIGMSKSGLYAHFKSKEELELAAIETATEIFRREVLAPARGSPRGLERVCALAGAYLGHLERRVFPGGCFFASVMAQLASRPGRTRDRAEDMLHEWEEQFVEAMGDAVLAGELPGGADLGQLVFEITAMLARANFKWIHTGDARVLDQARVGIQHVLERVSGRAAAIEDRVPNDNPRWPVGDGSPDTVMDESSLHITTGPSAKPYKAMKSVGPDFAEENRR
jgi:AcrR family transcriptional regulator